MGYSLEILNKIRDAASTEYQDFIPVATRDNYAAIGQSFATYTKVMNEFVDTLMHKIGLSIISDKMAKNKLERFKSGELLTASDVEEIFVEMVKGVAQDFEGTDSLKRKKPTNIKVMYHRANWGQLFEVCITDKQVRQAFRSPEGVQDLVAKQINSIYSGLKHSEFLAMKNLLATYGTAGANYFNYEVAEIVDEATAKEFVKTTRKAVSDLSYMSNLYNKAGVMTYCDKEDLVMIINKDVTAEVDVEVLAKAFNMGKTDFEPTIIEVDDFGTLTDTYAILCDKEFFKCFDTLRNMESQRNAKGMFTNYYLNVEGIMSLSTFKNAVRFKKIAAV